jgi:hypothetical protein
LLLKLLLLPPLLLLLTSGTAARQLGHAGGPEPAAKLVLHALPLL